MESSDEGNIWHTNLPAQKWERMANDLTCPICMELYTSPTMLPCSHVLCRPCATHLIEQNIIKCPICRTSYLLKHGVDSLTLLKPLARIIESYTGKSDDGVTDTVSHREDSEDHKECSDGGSDGLPDTVVIADPVDPPVAVPEEDVQETQMSSAKRCMIEIIGYLIYATLSIPIPMAMITIGAMYIDDCPIQPFIPYYLIVGGAFSLFTTIVVICWVAATMRIEDNILCEKVGIVTFLALSVVTFFMIAWLITGSVWIYGASGSVKFDPSHNSNYCNETLFQLAFWVTNSAWIIGAVIISVMLVVFFKKLCRS